MNVKSYIDTGSDGTIVTTDIDRRLELQKHPVTLVETTGIGGEPEVRVRFSLGRFRAS